MKKTLTLLSLLLLVIPASSLRAQSPADPALLTEISRIKAIDNHTHVTRVVGAGEEDHEYAAAWRALYGYKYSDMSEAHVRELAEIKNRIKRERGDAYPTWVLDQLGIETMLANRVAMGRGLPSPRFRWVSY